MGGGWGWHVRQLDGKGQAVWPAVAVWACYMAADAARSCALYAGMNGSVHGLVVAHARHATWLSTPNAPPALAPGCSFGERYLSSALFQTLREEAEAQTFDA